MSLAQFSTTSGIISSSGAFPLPPASWLPWLPVEETALPGSGWSCRICNFRDSGYQKTIPVRDVFIENCHLHTMLFPNGNNIGGIYMPKEKLESIAAIGNLIRKTRKEQRISQATLAGLSSVGTRYISDLENGKETIQIQKLLNVLNALGLGLYIYNRWDND